MLSVVDTPVMRAHIARMATLEVRAVAAGLAASASSDLAAHRDTGAAHIEVTHLIPDALVSLVDPAALPIEYGHGGYKRRNGGWVGASNGLHVLGKLL